MATEQQFSTFSPLHLLLALALLAQTVKNLPAMQETLGQEDLGEGNHNPLQYSRLENPWTEVPGGLPVHWVAKSRTLLSD